MQVPRGLETALTLERTTPGDKLVRETCALSLSSPAWDTPMWSVPDKSPFCALVVPGVDVGVDVQPVACCVHSMADVTDKAKQTHRLQEGGNSLPNGVPEWVFWLGAL